MNSPRNCGWSGFKYAFVLFFTTLSLLVASVAANAQSIPTHHMRPDVRSGRAKFLDRLPGTQVLRLDLVLPLRDPAGLEKFLQEAYDPASPSYRHFLTPSEFAARFGPTRQDYDAVVEFAKRNEFSIVGGSFEGRIVQIAGTVTSVEAAFNVSVGVYQHPTENRTFYSVDREPSAAAGIPLWHISGLDNYSIPHPAGLHHNSNAIPSATTGSGPSASFLGSDMRAAYYGSGALTGSGQYVGLLEFYGTDLADVTTYFTNAGQTNNVSINLISADGTSTTCLYSKRCDDTEQTLDITQALSMAPGMAGLYVFVGSYDTTIFSAMATHTPLAAQLGSSWTWSPADPSSDDPYFKQFAAQGQNLFQASGDSAAYTTKSTSVYPADDAYVTSVGGTDLVTSGAGGAWASETAWADGGGGYFAADKITIPSWQAPVINTNNKGSTTYRNAPDVAANSDYTYYVCADQTTCTANEYGGTSFAAPLWAGYMALVNQQAVANGNSPLGFVNPAIYSLGVGSGYSAAFHDITSGSNGYSALAGYDLATGWGSPNGAGLIAALAGITSAPNFSITASPSSLSVVRGNSGTSTISTTTSGGYNSTVTLAASGLPANVTASFGTNPIAAPGSGSSVVTFTVGAAVTAGTYAITVTGTSGDGTIVHTASISLTITVPAADFSIAASPSTITISRGSAGNETITTAALNGFSSSIALSASGLPSRVTVSFSPTSITGSGTSTMKITVNSRASTGTHTITITGKSGSKTHTATVALTVK